MVDKQISRQMRPPKFREQQLNKSKGILDDFAVRKVVQTKEGTITKTPAEELDLVNKKYVDAQVVNTGIDFFAYDSASDTGSYKQFKLVPSVGAEVEDIVNIAGSAVGQLAGARITEVSCNCVELINTLTAGVYNFHVHMKAAIANRLKFYAEFYVRAAGGTETLITTSETTDFIGTTAEGFDTHAVVTSEYPLTAGDRIVVKGYANNSSPAATNLYIYVEGTTATRVSIRGLTTPKDHAGMINLTWSSAGHTMDANLDMATHKIIGVVDPTANQEAATKKYVDDNVIAGGGPVDSTYVLIWGHVAQLDGTSLTLGL